MSRSDTEKSLKDLLYPRLNIQRVRTERLLRIGKPKADGPRTIIANFSSHKLKQLTLNNIQQFHISSVRSV